MNKQAQIHEVKTALDALGRNVKQIAASLQKLGITGAPQDGERCVLVRYLESTGLPLGVIDVSDEIVEWGAVGEPVRYRLPERFGKFVYRFDCLQYPELIDLAACATAKVKGGGV